MRKAVKAYLIHESGQIVIVHYRNHGLWTLV
jgi:hypothetical protein